MKKGFTLIELLISITIGMLMVGFGSVALSNFYEEQKVNSVVEELISNLRLASNYASTNQIPSSYSDADRVAVTLNNGLLVFGVQTTGNTGVGDSFFSKEIIPKDVGVTLYNNFKNDVVVKFSVTDSRSIGGSASIILHKENITKKIIIEESGLIYEE